MSEIKNIFISLRTVSCHGASGETKIAMGVPQTPTFKNN